MQTKQAAAIQAANDVAGLVAQIKAVRDAIGPFLTRYNSEGYSTTWGAMATATQNSDGSLGAADASPVASNAITVGNINRSKNTLVAAVVMFQQLQNFFGGQPVTAGVYNQTVDDNVS